MSEENKMNQSLKQSNTSDSECKKPNTSDDDRCKTCHRRLSVIDFGCNPICFTCNRDDISDVCINHPLFDTNFYFRE